MHIAKALLGLTVLTTVSIGTIVGPSTSTMLHELQAIFLTSVRAEGDVGQRKQVLPKEVRGYLKAHGSDAQKGVETADGTSTAQPTSPGMPPSRCSAPEVIDTVKSLAGAGTRNLLTAMVNLQYSLDAIRTVSSTTRLTICEARLTTSFEFTTPTRLPQEGPGPAGEPKTKQVHNSSAKELIYKVEKTDDGEDYITIIPSQADILQDQNMQQDERVRQYQEQQREQQQFDEDDRRNHELEQRYQNGQ